MNRKSGARIIISALIIMASGPVHANEKASLLILPFENVTGDATLNPLRRGVPDFIAAYMTPISDKIELIEREKLDQLMSEQGLKFENLLQESAAKQTAHLAQANYLLKGSFRGSKKSLIVQAGLYETETTRLLKTFEGHGNGSSAAAEQVASQVAKYFSASIPTLPSLPVDQDPEISSYMIQGLGYYHTGQYTKAFPQFMKILAKQPNDADAKYWLGKSFLGAGLKPQAKIEFRQFAEAFPGDARTSEVKKYLQEK